MKIINATTLPTMPLKILVIGPSGIGKTSLVKTIKDKVLVISAESGLLPLKGLDIDIFDVCIDDNGHSIPKEKRFERVREVYKFLLADTTYKWVFIDSLTEISDYIIDELKLKHPAKEKSFDLYADNATQIKGLVKHFRDLPNKNVVMTALPVVEKMADGERLTTMALVGKQAAKIPAMFDEVFYYDFFGSDKKERMFLTRPTNGFVAKDRSGKLNILETPNLSAIEEKINGVF